MSELVDFMLEKEKRILGALPEPMKLEEQAIICNCGSARFWLLRDGTAECSKCMEKQSDLRWMLTGI